MRIAIFYEHAFQPGGAPVGIRHFAEALSMSHDVYLWGKSYEADYPQLKSVRRQGYTSLIDLHRRLPLWIAETQPDILMIIGFFLSVNASVVWLAKKQRLPIVLHPLAQVWDIAFAGKIFTNGCNVRELEDRSTNKVSLKQKIASWMNPRLKAFFKHTLGRTIVDGSSKIAVLSGEEKRQFQQQYPLPDHRFVTLPWGIDTIDESLDTEEHFFKDVLGYNDDKKNLIVWGRLDWYYKGLDRLLDGVRLLKEKMGLENIPFRLFLCGPDYREGSLHVSNYVRRHGLDDIVILLLPGSYVPGGKAPLRDADVSLLLSPWDGSPRALRESIFYGTPILVSKATNFGEIVDQYECGALIENTDDTTEVAAHLLAATAPDRLHKWNEKVKEVSPLLDWKLVAERFIESLCRSNQLDLKYLPAR